METCQSLCSRLNRTDLALSKNRLPLVRNVIRSKSSCSPLKGPWTCLRSQVRLLARANSFNPHNGLNYEVLLVSPLYRPGN